MNRDWQLIKEILKYAESTEMGERGFLFHPDVPGYSDKAIEYHVRLCSEAGYVRTNSTGNIVALTWNGHEALDRLRKSSDS